MRRWFTVLTIALGLWTSTSLFSAADAYPESSQYLWEMRDPLLKEIPLGETKDDYATLANAQQRLAGIYKSRCQYASALKCYFNALANTAQNGGADAGAIYLEIADLLRINNRVQLAKKYLERALFFSIQTRNPRLLVRFLNTRAHLAFDCGDSDAASMLTSASAIIEHFLREYICYMDSVYLKTRVLKTRFPDNPNIASLNAALLRDAVQAGLKGKQFENILPIMCAEIRTEIKRGHLDAARLTLQELNNICSSRHPGHFFCTYLKGLMEEKCGRHNAARRLYRETGRILEHYSSNYPPALSSILQEEINAIFSGMTEYYLNQWRLNGQEPDLQEALFLIETKNGYSRPWSRRDGEIRSKQGDHFGRGELNIRTIRSRLPAGFLLLRYIIMEDRCSVIQIQRERFSVLPLSAAPSVLNRLTQALTEPLDEFTRGSVDYLHIHYDLEAARRLYDFLLRDVLKMNPGIRQLGIIPDGELFRVPFDALVSRFNESGVAPGVIFSEYREARYVIQDYAVSYFLSLFHVIQPHPAPESHQYELAAFGAPGSGTGDNGSGLYPSLKPLTSARSEIDEIARIFPGAISKTFYGPDFNRANFTHYAQHARIVHIASHFWANRDFPHCSALLFSGVSANGQTFPDWFYAHEVSNLRIPAELAALSACESSESHLLGYQGMRGMTASFRQAGVKMLLVGLWPVDQYSSQATPLFYQALQMNPDAGSALRIAKLELLKRTIPFREESTLSLAHPFIWSNFILYRFSAPAHAGQAPFSRKKLINLSSPGSPARPHNQSLRP